MSTIQEINASIIAGGFSNEQLDSIAMAIKFARNQLVQKNTGSLVVGTQVKFTNSRSGQTVLGKVAKVNRKYIHVQESNVYNSNMTRAGLWRVPANMLSIA